VQLASGGDGEVVDIAGGIGTESTGSKRFPQQALVSTSISVLVGLNPGSSCRDDYFKKKESQN